MKKNLIVLIFALFIFGCASKPQAKKEVLAKVNNYEIAKEEFDEEFKNSPYGRVNTLESKREFLQNLINRKLILQEAEAKGLNKEESFLKMIERFWEQSFLKLALDKKTKEIAGASFVSDKVIKDTYEKMFKDGKTDKAYDQMYNQIKWEVTKLKETQMLNDWIVGLRRKADVKVNESLLQ